MEITKKLLNNLDELPEEVLNGDEAEFLRVLMAASMWLYFARGVGLKTQYDADEVLQGYLVRTPNTLDGEGVFMSPSALVELAGRLFRMPKQEPIAPIMSQILRGA